MNQHKLIGISLLLLIVSYSGVCQSQKSFDHLISETNYFLEEYAKLSPFNYDNSISLEESGLPQKQIDEIREHYLNVDGYSLDSIAEYELLLEFQGLIIEKITELIAHTEFKNNKTEELISQNFDLYVVVSEDRKLYVFSLDEKTGGTYRSRISLTYFTEDENPPKLDRENFEITNQQDFFEAGGFNQIHTLETEEGTKYLLTGYVRGCSYCFETNVILISHKEGNFDLEFSFSVTSRSWEDGVIYNPESKTITVDYYTDDLTTECDCTNQAVYLEEFYDYSSDDEEELIQKKCHCTFVFNGLNFELIKESWEKVSE